MVTCIGLAGGRRIKLTTEGTEDTERMRQGEEGMGRSGGDPPAILRSPVSFVRERIVLGWVGS